VSTLEPSTSSGADQSDWVAGTAYVAALPASSTAAQNEGVEQLTPVIALLSMLTYDHDDPS
jgi:hypothetical protein